MGMQMRSPVAPVLFRDNSGIRRSGRSSDDSVVRLSSRLRSQNFLGGRIILVHFERVDGPERVCESRRVILNIIDAAWGKLCA